MYKITRTFNGETETLKASNSHLDKSFLEFVDAELLTKKLNHRSRRGYLWSVENTIEKKCE